MDNELKSIEDREAPSSDDNDNNGEDNYESQKGGQETINSEIDNEFGDLKENDYLPVEDEELMDEPVLSDFEVDPLRLKSEVKEEEEAELFHEESKGDLKYVYKSSNKDVCEKEIKSEEQGSIEMDDNSSNVGEGTGGFVLGEDTMDRIVCDICNEYSGVTESSFRRKLRSFCDSCYHNHLRKSKSEWMDVMYEWYESCMICMNVFNNSLDMVKHDCTCKNVYCCNNCTVMFVRKEEIEKHMKMCASLSSSLHNVVIRKSSDVRTGVSRRNSSKCHIPDDKGCTEELVDNIDKKVPTTSDRKKVLNRSSSIIKNFKCNYCDVCFRYPSQLGIHLRTHTGEKPFHCKICKKSFSISGNLKAHLHFHSGEKPFHCEICKKSFNKSGQLKAHLRTGEKPFVV